SEDMVRARLDILFSEEQQDLYMPDNYQAALHNILSDDIIGRIPEEVKLQLKNQIETQSVEQSCAAIIFELLDKKFNSEQEESIQQNLLDLSQYFLDTGDFINLRKIHDHWSKYLCSGNSSASIFNEKVISNHTQPTFMSEVLDGIDLWGEEKHQEIADYIVAVGEPYSEMVIEYLGLAPKWPERQLWMQILEEIGVDAQQMIIRSLKDERWYLVRNLLIVLGKDLDPKSMKLMHQLVGHQHPKVRLEVMRNLFSCNPATANRQLLIELNSEDPEAHFSAVQIADLSRDPTVLAILHKDLGAPLNSDTELELKKQTVRTLTRIGNKDSLPILRRILQKPGLLVSRRVKQLHVEIFKNLALFPGTSAEKLLQELAQGKHKQLAKRAIEERREFSRGGK
ncbi:MAG: HEAT repeat domain-containing protein, partial [Desulfuromusa sp.]|nr:HEAT repeat domain-containing protein [Desulfuromusa sp.]